MTKNTRKKKNLAVDKFLATVDRAVYEEFMTLCSHNPSVTDLHRYLLDIGYVGSLTSAYNWFNSAFPTGTIAQRVNLESQEAYGLNVAQMLLCRSSQLYATIQRLEQQIAEAELSDKEVLHAIPALCREMRAMAVTAEELKYIKDKQALIAAGADRALREIEQIFKDQPMESAVKAAIQAAWLKVEEELGKR